VMEDPPSGGRSPGRGAVNHGGTLAGPD
jgi:hypothetical protein